MLVSEAAIHRIMDEAKLDAKNFYLEKHGLIFNCVRDLYAASKPVDELSVSEALVQRNQIEPAGGKHYISELAANVSVPGNAKHYAEIVQQNSLLRRLLGAGQEIQGLVHNRNGHELGELHVHARELLDRATGTVIDAQGPTGALAAASVDLIATIRDGLPERAYVPCRALVDRRQAVSVARAGWHRQVFGFADRQHRSRRSRRHRRDLRCREWGRRVRAPTG